MPLALSDEALCQIMVAATKVGPTELDRWLKATAAKLEKRYDEKVRRDRHRQHRAAGEASYALWLDVVAVEYALQADNLLGADPTHEETQAALGEFVRLILAKA